MPAYAENYSEEILTPERASLRIRLRFDNGALLEINEALVVANGELTTLGYRYHLQRESNEQVFRYDNTPHFPDLPSFPHHKHLRDKVVAVGKRICWRFYRKRRIVQFSFGRLVNIPVLSAGEGCRVLHRIFFIRRNIDCARGLRGSADSLKQVADSLYEQVSRFKLA